MHLNPCRVAVALLLSVLLLGPSGCAPAKREIPSARVAGTVTLDGQPLDEGGVTFVPTAPGQGPTAWAKIDAGKYECPAVPLGTVLVQIHATRATGRKVKLDGMLVDERVAVGDRKFRQGVKLEVERDLENQDYALSSKSHSRQ